METADLEFRRQKAPWDGARGIDAALAAWRANPSIGRNLAVDRELPGREATLAEMPPSLAENLKRALLSRGIGRLYSHQARAFELSESGRDVVVATPTASGKSLCYLCGLNTYVEQIDVPLG